MPDIGPFVTALVHLKDAPAFADVLPSKIFEAMAMGLPILLVSPKGEASDLLQSHGVGEWVPSGNPGLFSDVVGLLSKDKPKCKLLSKASQNAAPQHSRENQARKMLEVFRWSLSQ